MPIAFTFHCGICGEDMEATTVFDYNRIQFVVPPCQECYDDAKLQAKAIVDKVTKGKDLDERNDMQ